jgi:hypothetical protein
MSVRNQQTIWFNIQTPEFSEKSRLALTGKRGKNQIVALLSALSSKFEKGFSVEFSELFSQAQWIINSPLRCSLPIPFNGFTTTPLTPQLEIPFWALVTTRSSPLLARNPLNL